MKNEKTYHIISVLVENRFGVLARVAGLFASRGFNIDSLCVGETEDKSMSRMTIVVRGDEKILEQIRKQLNKLIDVISVKDLTEEKHVERELVLIKIEAVGDKRAKVLEIVDIFRAKIVDLSVRTLTVEVTGDEDKIEAIINLLKEIGKIEITRTGKIAVPRG